MAPENRRRAERVKPRKWKRQLLDGDQMEGEWTKEMMEKKKKKKKKKKMKKVTRE